MGSQIHYRVLRPLCPEQNQPIVRGVRPRWVIFPPSHIHYNVSWKGLPLVPASVLQMLNGCSPHLPEEHNENKKSKEHFEHETI